MSEDFGMKGIKMDLESDVMADSYKKYKMTVFYLLGFIGVNLIFLQFFTLGELWFKIAKVW